MLDTVVSWPTLLVAVFVFGFAPGAALRLIVLAFHRDDPRRYELLAEVYAVPRAERPFWVAQQLEVAIFEGLGDRLVWTATGRIIHRWHLVSGVERNKEHPDTFYLPSEEERMAVTPGDVVKIYFSMSARWGELMGGYTGERMWVSVDAVRRHLIIGTLLNEPVVIPRLSPGYKVKFKSEHIIDIYTDDEIEPAGHGGDELSGDDIRGR